jgi:hypothetical protein
MTSTSTHDWPRRPRDLHGIELGDRVARALVMENSGAPKRRVWWIISSAVVAYSEAQRRGTPTAA